MIYKFLLSLILVSFGQPAWVSYFGPFASAFGFALFWRALLIIPKARDRFFLATIWFASVQSVQLSWMTATDYMGPLILVFYAFLILAMGLQFGLLSFFIKPKLSWTAVFAMAGTWTLFEWSRLYFLSGYTWTPVGLLLASNIFSLQWASVFGIYGLSFWVICTNILALKSRAAWVVFALIPYVYGFVQIQCVKKLPEKPLQVCLVQNVLWPEQKELGAENVNTFMPLQEQWERIVHTLDFSKKIDLLVLPETALSFGAHEFCYDLEKVRSFFEPKHLPPLRSPFACIEKGKWRVNHLFLLKALSNKYQTDIIAGLEDGDFFGQYNAAFHISPKSLLCHRYEKRVLVPIAEYLPLQNWPLFARFIDSQFGVFLPMTAGTAANLFHAPSPTGVSICIEETFNHLIREYRKKGAEILVNVTNDCWFPHSKLARQHFDHGRIRSVENGVPTLRACNTGITGGIDCLGQIIATLPISETDPGSLYFTLPVRTFPTLFTFWGNGVILFLSAIAILCHVMKKKLLEITAVG